MTSSLTLVSHEIAKIKIDREAPIIHNLCSSKTKGYDDELSITKNFKQMLTLEGLPWKEPDLLHC